MKKLIIAIILLCASTAFAGDQTLTFEWDASADATGYTIFMSDATDGTYAELNTEVITGVEWSYTFTEVIEEDRFFYVKATDGRNWSEPSNIVSTTIDTKAPAGVTSLTIESN